MAHIAHWARNPDPESNFARSIGRLPDVSDARLTAVLREKGYDGLIYADAMGIVGHCFFQRHEHELHAFATWVADRRRGGKLMQVSCFDFLAYASSQSGIERARIGTGHPADRLLSPLRTVSSGLGWRVRSGGWVDFSPGRE